MNGALAEPLVWSGRKRWIVIALAVGVQAGLILWFGATSPRSIRIVDARPDVQLVTVADSELLAVTAPTLFSRAHPKGFSGPAWLAVPPLPEPGQFPESAASPVWLAVEPGDLGATFRAFVRARAPGPFTLRNEQSPAVTQPSAPLILPAATNSIVEVEGALAARGLLGMSELPSWPNPDILSPSEVQVLVDARGNPVSALLLSGSGLKAADQTAVNLARSAQFGSAPSVLNAQFVNPSDGLVFGRLIFRWHTLPLMTMATNGLPNPR